MAGHRAVHVHAQGGCKNKVVDASGASRVNQVAIALILHGLRIVVSSTCGGIGRRDDDLRSLTGAFQRTRLLQIASHSLDTARLKAPSVTRLTDQRPDLLSLIEQASGDLATQDSGGPTTRIIVRLRPPVEQAARRP